MLVYQRVVLNHQIPSLSTEKTLKHWSNCDPLWWLKSGIHSPVEGGKGSWNPMIYKVLEPSLVVVWHFWTINSINIKKYKKSILKNCFVISTSGHQFWTLQSIPRSFWTIFEASNLCYRNKASGRSEVRWDDFRTFFAQLESGAPKSVWWKWWGVMQDGPRKQL